CANCLANSPHVFSFYSPRPLPALHSFPTRRSSDLYERGLLPFVSLIDAQRTEVGLQDRYYQAVADSFRRRAALEAHLGPLGVDQDRKSTRLNSSHRTISYAVFCLKKKKITSTSIPP